ncbi:TnsA endonuclease C-terminal domain-containing protein [Ureibacillus chungkukjangi]|uniref:TnsA endonuclease C-terminal domain-containing protein n=1 Tax=Ureibacillus chungkukjangi TaxID=1202712 RepID=UPI00203D00E7|nr:TnsA endonuclease C-terminal domain-containing protein [Ureibacillus chungkukjangi]MCM3390604.1 TnsA endonuclease C-terminal domain-containing protein [Ureibacillus chungkukjangi]
MIREWTDSTIKRFLKENRGQGEGATYKAWLQVQDIASQGRSTRIYSHKSQRVIHLLSDLQLYYFYLLEFDNQVKTVKEQYPLLDFYEQNIQLDEKLSGKLFNSKTNVPHVLTVTYLVTRGNENNVPYLEARVIKNSSELEKKATIDRLELMRRYFEKKDIDFGIVTEKEIDKLFARNIGWVLTAYDITDYPEIVGNFVYLKEDILELLKSKNYTFYHIFSRLEKSYQLQDGMGLILFKHLLATKQIRMDMYKKIELTNKIASYNIQQVKLGGENHAISS